MSTKLTVIKILTAVCLVFVTACVIDVFVENTRCNLYNFVADSKRKIFASKGSEEVLAYIHQLELEFFKPVRGPEEWERICSD